MIIEKNKDHDNMKILYIYLFENIIVLLTRLIKLYIEHLYNFSMFESHPELVSKFSAFEGKDVNKVKESGLLQQHALRVMSTVDKCITHINDPSSTRNILHEVGERHKLFDVSPDDIQVAYYRGNRITFSFGLRFLSLFEPFTE